MIRRPCLDCGQPFAPRFSQVARCLGCERKRQATRNAQPERAAYRGSWSAVAKAAIAAEPWCHTKPSCPYPDAGTSANPLTGDHRLPLSHGGTSTPDNCTVLCRSCNSSKRDRFVAVAEHGAVVRL